MNTNLYALFLYMIISDTYNKYIFITSAIKYEIKVTTYSSQLSRLSCLFSIKSGDEEI